MSDQRLRASPLSGALLALASVVAVIAALGAWADRQLLDNERWVATSSALLEDASIRNATSSFLAAELVDGPALADRLRSGLPKPLAPLAGPLSAQASELVERTAQRILASARFRELWRASNRLTHRQLIAAIDGEEGVLARRGVVLDLRPALGVLAQRIGVSPTPAPERGTVRVLDGDSLETVRGAVDLLHAVRWLSAALLVALLAAAVALSRDRPRTLVGAGAALLVAGVGLLVVRRVAGQQIVEALAAAGADERAARATSTIATTLLADIAGTGIVLAAVLAAAGWFGGRSRWAVRARRVVRPALVHWVGLVYAGAIVAVLALVAAGLVPAAGSVLALVLYLALAVAAVAALRRQIMREAA